MSSNISNQSTIPVDEDEEKMLSGQTSPEEPRSIFSGRARSNTETTLVSSAPTDSNSISTTHQPDVPVNTPVAGSIAGESVGIEGVLLRTETLKLDSEGRANGIVQAGGKEGKQDLESVMEAAVRDGVLEKTTWAGEAVEMATLGLKRLVQLAKDEHVIDPSKSVEEYYSEHLSKVINEAEIKFDSLALD